MKDLLHDEHQLHKLQTFEHELRRYLPLGNLLSDRSAVHLKVYGTLLLSEGHVVPHIVIQVRDQGRHGLA